MMLSINLITSICISGRHSREEIAEMACDDIQAISAYLADKPFLLGDTVSSIDATLYGMLCSSQYFFFSY